MSDVFSRKIRRINARGMTYQRMAAGCGFERSSAWWNNMANYDMETPPAPKYLPGIAKVMRLPERRVAEMVAEQWYDVRPDDEIPEHLQSLVAVLRGIDPKDVALVEQLAQTLSDKYTSQILLDSLDASKASPAAGVEAST